MNANEWKEKLYLQKKNGGLVLSEEELQKADAFCEEYKNFLNSSKTEREAVHYAVARAEKLGFTPFDAGKAYKAGDKVYLNNRGKALILAVVGKKDLREGVHILAAHTDSPRLDLKQVPVYEDNEMGYLKTHYYGGIKKYQWVTIPLALHGVLVKNDGFVVTVRIGEDEGDPVFCITDLLPHLAADQMKRPAGELIRGEELNVVIGSRPFRDDDASERVKLNLLKLLFEKYGVTEADFLSAELEVVPAFKASDVGLDRSFVGSYGQDDRVCAYTEMEAVFDCGVPDTTVMCIFADKEEIGSVGCTGMKSAFLRHFIEDLAAPYGIAGRTVLQHSQCLSADVSAAFDPTFPEVCERKNNAFVNYGVSICKYTGARGKSGSSDASAEFMGWVRKILDEGNVLWQTSELGKVDQGGGGTVAAYIAELDVDTIDVGVPVLSMHAPYEMTAKIDVYSAYRAFVVFCKA